MTPYHTGVPMERICIDSLVSLRIKDETAILTLVKVLPVPCGPPTVKLRNISRFVSCKHEALITLYLCSFLLGLTTNNYCLILGIPLFIK